MVRPSPTLVPALSASLKAYKPLPAYLLSHRPGAYPVPVDYNGPSAPQWSPGWWQQPPNTAPRPPTTSVASVFDETAWMNGPSAPQWSPGWWQQPMPHPSNAPAPTAVATFEGEMAWMNGPTAPQWSPSWWQQQIKAPSSGKPSEPAPQVKASTIGQPTLAWNDLLTMISA